MLGRDWTSMYLNCSSFLTYSKKKKKKDREEEMRPKQSSSSITC